jgi:formate-dependent nitrite reductase membrane component NrfD
VIDWRGFLFWIENSALGELIRGFGVWTYGIVNLVHILGVATLFGSVLILDLRLLGWRRNASLADTAHMTTPLAVIGFGLAVFSGICMLATNGSEYADNPFLPIKFGAIALALLNAATLVRLPAWKSKSDDDKTRVILAMFGGISLLSWIIAIGAGRMIGYW